jgi:glycosyltransferase involved in cell wall biosynthesis
LIIPILKANLQLINHFILDKFAKMEKEKIIFIYPKAFTFIETEIKLLSSEYQIISQDLNWANKYLLPFNLFLQFFFLVFNLFSTQKVLISFGGYWSLLPGLFGKIFSKKVAIVVHGTDCVSFPKINYGNLRIPLMRWFTKHSYQLADIILPVSGSLFYTENNYYSEETLKFGYSHHLKSIKTPYKIIPNGLIIEDWKSDNLTKEDKSFITVMTENQILRKGGDLIVKTAELLPECSFYIAGTKSIKNAPKNVICLGRLTPAELKSWYKNTQFYLQLSNFEGFGVSICEAMLCRCVPIVSDVNFLPTIAGESGFVLRKRDADLLKELIVIAFQKDLENLGIIAMERIKNNFPISKRKEMLISILNNL